MGTGTGVGTKTRAVAEMGTRMGTGTGTRTGSGRAEERRRSARNRTSCRHGMGNGGDLGKKREKCRQESVGSVAANPDNLEHSKKPGRETQGIQGLSKNCTIG